MNPSPLVNSTWLSDHLNHPDLIILDATLAKPKTATTDIHNSDLQIKGARFFDSEAIRPDTAKWKK